MSHARIVADKSARQAGNPRQRAQARITQYFEARKRAGPVVLGRPQHNQDRELNIRRQLSPQFEIAFRRPVLGRASAPRHQEDEPLLRDAAFHGKRAIASRSPPDPPRLPRYLPQAQARSRPHRPECQPHFAAAPPLRGKPLIYARHSRAEMDGKTPHRGMPGQAPHADADRQSRRTNGSPKMPRKTRSLQRRHRQRR